MNIIDEKELFDGSWKLEIELTTEESKYLIQEGLIRLLKDLVDSDKAEKKEMGFDE